jgi:hypothetical protein
MVQYLGITLGGLGYGNGIYIKRTCREGAHTGYPDAQGQEIHQRGGAILGVCTKYDCEMVEAER